MSLKYEPASEPLHIFGGGDLLVGALGRVLGGAQLRLAGRGPPFLLLYRGTSLIRNYPPPPGRRAASHVVDRPSFCCKTQQASIMSTHRWQPRGHSGSVCRESMAPRTRTSMAPSTPQCRARTRASALAFESAARSSSPLRISKIHDGKGANGSKNRPHDACPVR